MLTNIRFISQLIRGFSWVLQKLLKYFNGTAISTSLVLPAARPLPIILTLTLNDSEYLLRCCHKRRLLILYSIRLYMNIVTSRSIASSTCVLVILQMQSVNVRNFWILNITWLLFSSTFLDAKSPPARVIAIASFTGV